MNIRQLHLGTLTLAVAVSAVLACGEARARHPPGPNLGTNPQGTGGDSTGGNTGGNGQRPTGPVDSVSVVPANVTLALGSYAALHAQAFNKAGERLADQPATWRSSDAAIAPVRTAAWSRDSPLGTATITATINGHSASAPSDGGRRLGARPRPRPRRRRRRSRSSPWSP